MQNCFARRALVCFFLCLIAACATSTPVEEAPLPDSKQQELRKTLVGSWRHIATIQGGQREPAMAGEGFVQWTFRKDGTLKYRQKVPSVGVDQSRTTKWRLEGRNIVMEGGERGKTVHYRVDDWGDEKMKWFNYTGSNTYVVKRVD